MRTIFAIVMGAAATVLLVVAVFMNELPGALRGPTFFDDDTEARAAATSWARWLLVVLAIALVLLPRLWGRVVWPEVALAFLVSVSIGAAWAAHYLINHPKAKTTPATVPFTLSKDLAVRAAADVAESNDVVLLVIEPEKQADDKPISYTSTRYEAKLTSAVKAGEVQDDLTVALERGNKDANAKAFSADLAGATQVYVVPAR